MHSLNRERSTTILFHVGYNILCFGQETACSPVEAEQLVFPVELILI